MDPSMRKGVIPLELKEILPALEETISEFNSAKQNLFCIQSLSFLGKII